MLLKHSVLSYFTPLGTRLVCYDMLTTGLLGFMWLSKRLLTAAFMCLCVVLQWRAAESRRLPA